MIKCAKLQLPPVMRLSFHATSLTASLLLPPHIVALATSNAGPEAAAEWVFAHMEDPDFNDPLPAPVPVANGDAANKSGEVAWGLS